MDKESSPVKIKINCDQYIDQISVWHGVQNVERDY